jgi:hypothetical protein
MVVFSLSESEETSWVDLKGANAGIYLYSLYRRLIVYEREKNQKSNR